MHDFAGQIAVVTGATRGIGRAIAQALLAGGATVFATYAGNQEAAARLAADNANAGERLRLCQFDVADHEQVQHFFGQVETEFGHIDILVCNAGIRKDGVLAMMPVVDWQRVLDVNLTGSFNMAKHAVLLMLRRRYGRIIFITSPMAHAGFAGQANYAASKAGQIGMARSLSKETASRKITVNCVSPGFIDTELLTGLSADQLVAYKKSVPIGRFGKPEEVADAVLFLCGPKAAYITGSVLEVNGGL